MIHSELSKLYIPCIPMYLWLGTKGKGAYSSWKVSLLFSVS